MDYPIAYFVVALFLCVQGIFGNSQILRGNYQKIGGIEIVWQSPTTTITGVVFLAHGCAHSATDWFPQSDSCRGCIGLPVEMDIVERFLTQGYVVFATSSIERVRKCWNDDDIPNTATAVNHIYKTLHLNILETPLFALGASSGGYFVSLFGQHAPSFNLKVSAICMQISGLYDADPATPPVIFVHMAKDRQLAHHIMSLAQQLVRKGVPAEHYPCRPKTVTPEYFTSWKVLTHSEASNFTTALQAADMVSPVSHLLTVDPLTREWVQIAKDSIPNFYPDRDALVNDISPMFELMKLAWAAHEITNDFLHETLDFFKRNTNINTVLSTTSLVETQSQGPEHENHYQQQQQQDLQHGVSDSNRVAHHPRGKKQKKPRQYAFD
eukprot:gene5150-10292_t